MRMRVCCRLTGGAVASDVTGGGYVTTQRKRVQTDTGVAEGRACDDGGYEEGDDGGELHFNRCCLV